MMHEKKASERRVCPTCSRPVAWNGHDVVPCPHCGSEVWYFHFDPLPTLNATPGPVWRYFLRSPLTASLSISVALLSFATLIGIFNQLYVSVIATLICIGFAAFAFFRHSELARLDAHLDHVDDCRSYVNIARNRLALMVHAAKDQCIQIHALRTAAEASRSELESSTTRIHEFESRVREAESEVDRLRALCAQESARSRDAAEKLRVLMDSTGNESRTSENRLREIATRLVGDNVKWALTRLRPDPDNYMKRRTELDKTFDFVAHVGCPMPRDARRETMDKLKESYAKIVREQTLKDEQKRINQRMREEERIRREREDAADEAERREAELRERLDEALREHRDTHDAKVMELERLLAEAHAASERAKSMAQLTKAGHVYILSNLGSFGENVFKVGMTRRLDPHDRVKELGDASVPFPFDVHAMIACDNAPALENSLHRELTRYRVNRINLRKEFFQVELQTILNVVIRYHGTIEYVAEPEALEYRDSQDVNPDDLERIECEFEEMGVSVEDEE